MSKAVYAKILELQKAVVALKKDSKSYNFEYLSGDKLFEVVRPKMDDLGLLLLPDVQAVHTTPTTYKVWDSKLKAVVEKTENLVSLDINFTWVDAESGETLTQHWHGTGQNGFDKSFGSALTYAERYFFLKTFHIATNKDDVDALAEQRDKAIEGAAAAAVEQGRKEGYPPAPVQEPASPVFKTINEMKQTEEFWQWVKAAAINKLSKNGKPAAQAFQRKFRCTAEQMTEFTCCVDDMREAIKYEQEQKNGK